MFTKAWDLPDALGVQLLSGPENSAADYESYIASCLEFDASVAPGSMPGLILVVDPENPVPDAAWRKRISEATQRLRSRPLFALVTRSMAARGVVTAINWLRPPPYEFAAHETFEQAVGWIERKRGHKLPRFHDLLAECRVAARGPRSAPMSGRAPASSKR